MRKFGIETASFAKQKAFNAEVDNLAIAPTMGTMRGGEGVTLKKGQSQQLTYQLNAPRLLNLVFTFQVLAGKAKIDLVLNERNILQGFEPAPGTKITKNLVVNTNFLQPGTNKLTILVGGSPDVSLLLAEVSVGNFEIRKQRQTNWCWVATGLSVADYLSRTIDNGEQCTMYDRVKKVTGSCQYPERKAPDTMNATGWPAGPLHVTNHCGAESKKPLPWDQVLAETAANRPLICIINWVGGGRHAVVLSHAYAIGSERYVVVDDPLSGARSTMTYDRFLTAYLKDGDRWTETILSK